MSKQNVFPLMRDQVNIVRVKSLADNILKNYKTFDKEKFIKIIQANIAPLGLNERILLITEQLHVYLPANYLKALPILVKSLEKELPSDINDIIGENTGHSLGFINSSLTLYVSKYGVDYHEESLNALYEMTKRFTSEWAIRTYLISDEKKTLKVMKKWAKDKNLHIRRLVSEGSRPRIPWGIKLKSFVDDPTPVINLLNMLKDDPCLYVRRSVANNLNDIAKDHPNVVTSTLKKWRSDKSKNMTWLISHALRTLIKNGDPKALELIGYSPNIEIDKIKLKILNNIINLGESLEFSFDLVSKSTQPQQVLIDYIVYHQKANGTLAPKVFKLTKKVLPAKGKMLIVKKHLIKEISTRKYYSGKHEVHIQINGKNVGSGEFKLSI